MSSKTNGMTYEEMPLTKTKDLGKRTLVKGAERLSSTMLVWILFKRHKIHMLVAGNILYFVALPLYKTFYM